MTELIEEKKRPNGSEDLLKWEIARDTMHFAN
jgi:hypothetical protein